ncbi:MAG: hypothetical protein QOE13_482, partial [Gaiellaceae bacterium]|nr:hypothetical protein [Gaiellaceae bacterium]
NAVETELLEMHARLRAARLLRIGNGMSSTQSAEGRSWFRAVTRLRRAALGACACLPCALKVSVS